MSVSVVTGEYEYAFSHLNPLYYFACDQDQNQNSLSVKRENDNTSPGLGGGRLVPVVRQFSGGNERIKVIIQVHDSLVKDAFLIGIFTSRGH